jgi:DNA-binding CsgD family transcriptional regulator/tetratricopeptide (TPR) repeat protein
MSGEALAWRDPPPSQAHADEDLLVGRGPEISRLRALTNPESTAGRVLVVLGHAGAGKSVLLADLARHARPDGFRVLAISGRQPETNLEFAGLHQLLRPLACHVHDLPGLQRDALLRVLGHEQEASCADRLVTATAALSLLTRAAKNRPLLATIDDAHWLDRSSLDVLAFIGHRLDDEQVVLVLSSRGLAPPPALGSGFPELHLGRLSACASTRLLDSLPHPPAGRARSQVITQAAGNPLALIELARAVTAGPSARQCSVQLPLPLGDALAARFAGAIAQLPALTRTALLVVAADIPVGSSTPVAAPDIDAEALAPAERLGLITVETSGVRFSDPLLQSAIYHGAPFSERAAAHRQLAASLDHQPDLQAWHLAAATLRPDEAIAARLESTAALARQREGAVGAALALERAAELSPGTQDRARRLTSAASAAVATGQAGWVHDLARRALAIGADAELRLTASRAAGWALAWTNQHPEALSILLAVANDAADCQPSVAWDALATAAIVAYLSGALRDRELVCQVLYRLERQAPPHGSRAADACSSGVLGACIRASTDPFGGRADLVARLQTLDAAASTELAVPGAAAWVLDEPGLAIRLLTDTINQLKTADVRGNSGVALSILSRAYADAGQWDDALASAAKASELAAANQLDVVAASAGLTAATVRALRAEAGDAGGELARVLARVGQAESSCIGARARHAAGLAAFADGSRLTAYAQLRQLFLSDGTPLHYHVSYLGIADLAAAAVRADRHLEGRRIIAHAVLRLEGASSPRLEQLTARAHGLLAEPADAVAHFERALSDPAGNRWPFERAQLQLDHGELLRRLRRISDARPFLAAAAETFRGLKATSWARRAEAELRACGIGVADTPGTPEALADLTSQQREIVCLAGSGLTNREIADRMFLSPRTVSSHLYRAYPKLGVAGRHQLRTVIAPAPSLVTGSSGAVNLRIPERRPGA